MKVFDLQCKVRNADWKLNVRPSLEAAILMIISNKLLKQANF